MGWPPLLLAQLWLRSQPACMVARRRRRYTTAAAAPCVNGLTQGSARATTCLRAAPLSSPLAASVPRHAPPVPALPPSPPRGRAACVSSHPAARPAARWVGAGLTKGRRTLPSRMWRLLTQVLRWRSGQCTPMLELYGTRLALYTVVVAGSGRRSEAQVVFSIRTEVS